VYDFRIDDRTEPDGHGGCSLLLFVLINRTSRRVWNLTGWGQEALFSPSKHRCRQIEYVGKFMECLADAGLSASTEILPQVSAHLLISVWTRRSTMEISRSEAVTCLVVSKDTPVNTQWSLDLLDGPSTPRSKTGDDRYYTASEKARAGKTLGSPLRISLTVPFSMLAVAPWLWLCVLPIDFVV